MPQFDIFSFSSQIFWVFFSFYCIYLTFTFALMPSMAFAFKIRTKIFKEVPALDIYSGKQVKTFLSVIANNLCYMTDIFWCNRLFVQFQVKNKLNMYISLLYRLQVQS